MGWWERVAFQKKTPKNKLSMLGLFSEKVVQEVGIHRVPLGRSCSRCGVIRPVSLIKPHRACVMPINVSS